MTHHLNGRVTIVTGAARGIGRGIASVFSAAGAVVCLADLDAPAGERAAAELSAAGGAAEFVPLDVTSEPSCEAAVQTVLERHGRLDVLCSNAGIYPQARIAEMTEADWERVFAINAKGTFFMVKTVLPTMRAQHGGRIVLTSSVTGPLTGYPGWAHYGATKAAMLGFMRSAALEVAADGITVNAVLPGNILTESLQQMGPAYLDALAASIPMKRLGRPEDVGHAMLFRASDEAAYITGQTIVVDGGQVLPEGVAAVA